MQLLITGLGQFQSGGVAPSAKRVEIRNEQVHFIMRNEEIWGSSVSNRQKEPLRKCSLLAQLALG